MNYITDGLRPDPLTPAGEDLRDQSVVLNYILHLYPQTLTFEELSRELTGNSRDFERRDQVERAVTALVGTGLLRRVDTLVLPTRAATHFYGIGGGW
jgi:hypothetical protein